MPYDTQWNTPRPPRPSGSTIVSAKLLVSAGAPLHDSCGDTFWPTQFGLGIAGLFTFATLAGIIVPSLNVVEESAKGV